MHSQTISRAKITSSINSNGDTIINMPLAYAKSILNDVLDKKIVDSLLIEFKKKDSLNLGVISIQKNTIELLQTQGNNKDIQLKNFEKLLANKEVEITALKKQILKQKLLKVIGFTGSVVLPILILFIVK